MSFRPLAFIKCIYYTHPMGRPVKCERWFDKGQWPKAHCFLNILLGFLHFLMLRKRSTSFIYLIIFNMFLARALNNITNIVLVFLHAYVLKVSYSINMLIFAYLGIISILFMHASLLPSLVLVIPSY